eukprot:CAMPEP_0202873534 /NCGR_PEP_ID=MMETSP1391-20130828/23432_1 /ASSEMBLY_ACC=CAM_ASM_000867 /TAXON_ID=1034604 /ORGANISM="Chlamydomonas leiostraca, Strain SAG 11-49" /LENGTH=33 /DNA_ID= /DNA_START= /DNA_END= /DNA_ORIENTATION=
MAQNTAPIEHDRVEKKKSHTPLPYLSAAPYQEI